MIQTVSTITKSGYGDVMTVRINIDPNKVQARVMGVWNDNILGPLSEEILADCNEYCKEDTGALIQSSIIHSQPTKGILKWVTPYAKRQYWDIETSRTPGRTWKWCETAKKKWKDRWKNLAERWFRQYL